MGAVQEFDRGGTTEPSEIRNRSGDHDDRSRIARRIHDVSEQACPHLFLLPQTDVGVPFTIFYFYFWHFPPSRLFILVELYDFLRAYINWIQNCSKIYRFEYVSNWEQVEKRK